MIKNFLFVGLGGGLGAMLRYGLSMLIKNAPFPFATLLINVMGSFILGIIMATTLYNSSVDSLKLFLAVGICGGFTTFSAFAFENIRLLQSGKYEIAFLYILLSITLSLVAVWAGLQIVK